MPVTNTGLVGDNDRMFHRVEAVGDPERWRPVTRDALVHPVGADRWEIRNGTDVLARHRSVNLRVSLSWKAEVFLDEAERRRRDEHLDDLGVARALEILTDELRARGKWGQRPGDPREPAFVAATMASFPGKTPRPG
jgi:hypothetical protein